MKKGNSLNFETTIPSKRINKEDQKETQNFDCSQQLAIESKPQTLINFMDKSHTSKVKNVAEEQKQENIKPQMKKKPTISLEIWLKTEGQTLLQESLKNLKINQNHIHKSSVELMDLQELEEKKKLVKNELKRYDLKFESFFNRSPIRNEKEPMRPLYIYYKMIKQYLGDDQTSKSNNHIEKKTQIIYQNNINNNNKKNNEDNKKSKSFEISNETNKMEKPLKISLNEIKKRLDDLKKLKNDLRNKLHNYQQNFSQDNNRKIKYHKDIAPVEEDYKRYKELKAEIQKIEEVINSSSLRGSGH